MDTGHGEHVRDTDWVSRRWQGEGQVVRHDPVHEGEPPVKASREAGDSLFERGLGEHCGLCQKLDLLPLACQFCAEPFCAECIDIDVHRCPKKHAHQPRRVPDMSGWANPGDRVRLEGLVKTAVHNGKEAVVLGASLKRGSSGHDRFLVRTSTGTELRVKPMHMRHAPHQDDLAAPTPTPDQQATATTLQREPERAAPTGSLPANQFVNQAPVQTATSYRTRSGAVISSTLEFLLESKLSRYSDQVRSTIVFVLVVASRYVKLSN